MVMALQTCIILILALATCLFAYLLRRALKDGECFMKGQRLTRTGEPIGYWTTIAILFIWVISPASVAIHFMIQFFLQVQAARSLS